MAIDQYRRHFGYKMVDPNPEWKRNTEKIEIFYVNEWLLSMVIAYQLTLNPKSGGREHDVTNLSNCLR